MKPGKCRRIRDIWIVPNSMHKSLGIWHRIIAQHELVNMGRWEGVMKSPKEKPGQKESQVQQQGSLQATVWVESHLKLWGSPQRYPWNNSHQLRVGSSSKEPYNYSALWSHFKKSVSRRNSNIPGDLVSIGCSSSSSDINPNLPSKSLI